MRALIPPANETSLPSKRARLPTAPALPLKSGLRHVPPAALGPINIRVQSTTLTVFPERVCRQRHFRRSLTRDRRSLRPPLPGPPSSAARWDAPLGMRRSLAGLAAGLVAGPRLRFHNWIKKVGGVARPVFLACWERHLRGPVRFFEQRPNGGINRLAAMQRDPRGADHPLWPAPSPDSLGQAREVGRLIQANSQIANPILRRLIVQLLEAIASTTLQRP